jgi:hypothetical protein
MVDGDTYGIDGEDETTVVYYGYRDTENGIPNKADACLIAAAPDLLLALEALLDMDISYQRGPKVQEAESAARLAVAKARGAQ